MNILAGRGNRSSVTAVQNLSTNWKKTTSRIVPRKDLRYRRERESARIKIKTRGDKIWLSDVDRIRKNKTIFWSNYRIPVHYYILEAASFEEGGISIHMQIISGRVF